jgi:hypothetical protein
LLVHVAAPPIKKADPPHSLHLLGMLPSPHSFHLLRWRWAGHALAHALLAEGKPHQVHEPSYCDFNPTSFAVWVIFFFGSS